MARVTRHKHQSRKSRANWAVMGAFVASATFGPRAASPVSAQELKHRLEKLRVVVLAETRLLGGRDAADQAGERPRRFDIQTGPLRDVLAEFERVTGIHVIIASESISDITSAGVSGSYTVAQALTRLLEGTSVTFRFSGVNTVSIEIRLASESVSVTADSSVTLASPRFTEPVRDIPQTITVIPSQLMVEQGAATLRDVLRNVPGITMQAGEGGTPAGDQLTIRGFSARTDMFIDGVRDFGGYARDSFNLEQVEVVKGPAFSSVGRGSTGGSINMVSKTPSLQGHTASQVTGGSAHQKRATFDVNRPLESVGGMAIRFNAMVQDSGVPGRDVVKNGSWGMAPSVSFGLGRPTQVTASFLHLSQDNVPDYGVPWVPATNVPLAAYANQPAPVDQSNFYGMKNRDYEDVNNNLGTVVVERHVGSTMTLRNQVRYGRTRRDSMITSPRFLENTSTTIRRTDWKSRDQFDTVLANHSDLVARFETSRAAHAVTSGMEFSREHDLNYTRIETGPTAPNTDLYSPNPNDPYVGGLARNGARTDAVASSAAGYLFDTMTVGQHWELTGGLRFDRFDVDYESKAADGVVTPFERTDSMLSWHGGVVYKPRPNGSIYAGYGTSFNPSAEGLALSAATVGLEPEKTRNVEVGTKWDVFRRLSVSAALFRTEKTNARTPGINPGDPPTVLQGKQIVSGIELGAAGNVTDRWSIFTGYAYMPSRIEASNTAAEVDSNLTNTPLSTFSLWTTFRMPWELSLGGGAQYMDTVFRNAINTTSVPSYWLVNAMASRPLSTTLTLRLNAYNLMNEDYVDRFSGGHFIPGTDRAVALTAGFSF